MPSKLCIVPLSYFSLFFSNQTTLLQIFKFTVMFVSMARTQSAAKDSAFDVHTLMPLFDSSRVASEKVFTYRLLYVYFANVK